MSKSRTLPWLAVDLGVLSLIVAGSLYALRPYYWNMVAAMPWETNFVAVLPATAVAALKVWTFWGVGTVIVAGVLLRCAPSLGLLDALLGGALSIWVFAYIGCNLLGPIGLFRSWTIWLVLAVAGVALWRAGPPRIRTPALSTGQWLTLLAFAMIAPGLLLMQLGSPVPPHFDVFAPPAAAQRIVTFGRYLPWDNDAYGYWGVVAACPGTELFYALLALGSRTLAVMAETGVMVPMTALFIAVTYRLGKTLAGDVAGGMAALLLAATVLFRALPYGHGRYVAFVPALAGMAFILDSQQHPVRLVLGALFLGTAVAAHAIIGAFAMATVAATVPFWILRGDFAIGLAAVGLLAGATLIALPSVAVALQVTLPYPVMPALQLLGVGLAVFAARRMPRRPAREAWWLSEAVMIGVLVLMWRQPRTVEVLYNHWECLRFPILTIAAGLGLVVLVLTRTPARRLPLTLALVVGIAASYGGNNWQEVMANPAASVAVHDFSYKAEFWYPLALAFPASCLLAFLARLLPLRAVVYPLLFVLWFPWRYEDLVRVLGVTGPVADCVTRMGARDPNYYQVSVAELIAEQLQLAKHGYWGNRWAQTPAEFDLIDILREEISAGRITTDTTIVHLRPAIILYKDVMLFSVYAGINDAPYIANYVPDRSTDGGRIRPIEKVGEALAEHPRYVVVHDVTTEGTKLADLVPSLPDLSGYEELFNRDGVRLLRARGPG